MKPFHQSVTSSDEFLQRVLASSPDCIKILDMKGNLLAMSEGGQKILQIEDLTPHLHTCWTGWWHGEARADAIKAVDEAKRGGTGRFEAFAHNFAGNPMWWDVTVSPIMGTDGQIEKLLSVSRDITRRKVAELELAEARAKSALAAEAERVRLIDVFKRSPSFITVLSGPRHIYELANDGYCRLIGRRATDILHKPVREVLTELKGQGFFELLDRVYATGEPFVGNDVSVLLQSEPGQAPVEHFVDFVFQPTHAADGSIDGVFVHGIDWSERKRAQANLAEVAEQRRLALDSAQMGWWHVDLDTGQLHMDDRFKTIFDVDREDDRYMNMLERIHPDDRDWVDAAVRAATRPKDSVPYAIEYRVVHRDGSIHWVAAKGQTTFKGEGEARRATGFAGTMTDITADKAIRDAVQESEARFREVANAMPQIVWTAPADCSIDYYNEGWYEYTGAPRGTGGKASWEGILHPDDLQRVIDLWVPAVASGQPWEMEFRLRRAADGAYRWFLGRSVPLKDANGKVVRWIGTDTDIHEQKLLQEQNELLLASERAARSEAERTSRIKDEFLATLSHELRTPLNAILGWTQVLRGDLNDAEEIGHGLDTIERNARAQNQIIEDLLDMSKIISGKVRLDVQSLNLNQVIAAAVETMRLAADAKGIRLQALIDPNARLISGDPNRLQQVFWNLLSNAIKFTPKGGKVQVLLERVNSHLEVRVADSGEGIAPEFLPHVFDRFRQADASTTRRHGGLGLGLAIVKQLVELHGGSVHVESAGSGRGTTFTVMLPIAVIQPAPVCVDPARRLPHGESVPLPIPPELLQLTGIKVLVVDDEADARELVKRLLEDRAAEVQTASSVSAAVEFVKALRPDVVVSDIGMPEEDGYSLIRRVRELAPEQGGNTPAIALTAYARSEDRLQAILAGFQMHMAKPVEAAELLAQVASLTGRVGGQR